MVNELWLGCFDCLMPLSDTITLQSSLPSGVVVEWLSPSSHGRNLANFVRIKNNKLSSRWKTGLQLSSGGASKSRYLIILGSIVIKAVAMISPVENARPVFEENVNIDSRVQSGLDRICIDDTKEMPSKKDQWRLRISKANKGKVPWNKGRKHSPETVALIRERTKQAMRDPKVKKKIMDWAGHPHSEDTKMKIGIAVKKAIERRRKRKKLQETCLLQWEESIAESAKIGADGEDELQWDSYAILKEKMHEDWLQAVERKRKDKRAPKSVEQKKNISKAIKAKWEDPVYRQRVCSGMQRVYQNRPQSSVRRVVRKRPVNENGSSSSVRRVVRKQTLKNGAKSTAEKSSNFSKELTKYKNMSPTPFSDPLAGEKLDRIKQLRANRSSIERMKREAAERARLLIAEAEKAAKSLEAAAVTDASAQASLFETRKLLSEAIRAMQSVESSSYVDAHVLQRNPGTDDDAETFQSNHYMDNSLIIPSPKPGPFDINGMHYLSFSNTEKENYYDTYKSIAGSALNDMLTGDVSHHAHKDSPAEIIGRAEVLSYVNSLFGTPNLTTEDPAKTFEAMTDATTRNNTMPHSEKQFSSPSVNHSSMVDESAVLGKTEEFEEGPRPNLSKDNTASVDANSVASMGQTEDIAGISESGSAKHPSVNHSSMVGEDVVLDNTAEFENGPVPNLLEDITMSGDANSFASKGQANIITVTSDLNSVHTGSNGIVASNKDVKKKWIRGRLIEVKGE